MRILLISDYAEYNLLKTKTIGLCNSRNDICNCACRVATCFQTA